MTVRGCGSRQHNGARKQHRVESCLGLDVNELRHKGALAFDAAGSLIWDREGDAEGSVAFRTAALVPRFRD